MEWLHIFIHNNRTKTTPIQQCFKIFSNGFFFFIVDKTNYMIIAINRCHCIVKHKFKLNTCSIENKSICFKSYSDTGEEWNNNSNKNIISIRLNYFNCLFYFTIDHSIRNNKLIN